MLGKLIKNEFNATARAFGAMYLSVFIVTVALKLFVEIQDAFHIDNVVISVLGMITTFAFLLGIIGVVIGTFILILKRFYDSMLKSEGYLSFTLPATVGQHIASKSIVSYVWFVVSGVFIFAIIMVLFLGDAGFFVELRDSLTYIMEQLSRQNMWRYVILIGIVLAVVIYNCIAMGYACFSVGQAWMKNKVAGALVTYIIFKVVIEIASLIGMWLLFRGDMDAIVNDVGIGDAIFQPILIFAIVQEFIVAVVCTIATHFALSKKLNLE